MEKSITPNTHIIASAITPEAANASHSLSIVNVEPSQEALKSVLTPKEINAATNSASTWMKDTFTGLQTSAPRWQDVATAKTSAGARAKTTHSASGDIHSSCGNSRPTKKSLTSGLTKKADSHFQEQQGQQDKQAKKRVVRDLAPSNATDTTSAPTPSPKKIGDIVCNNEIIAGMNVDTLLPTWPYSEDYALESCLKLAFDKRFNDCQGVAKNICRRLQDGAMKKKEEETNQTEKSKENKNDIEAFVEYIRYPNAHNAEKLKKFTEDQAKHTCLVDEDRYIYFKTDTKKNKAVVQQAEFEITRNNESIPFDLTLPKGRFKNAKVALTSEITKDLEEVSLGSFQYTGQVENADDKITLSELANIDMAKTKVGGEKTITSYNQQIELTNNITFDIKSFEEFTLGNTLQVDKGTIKGTLTKSKDCNKSTAFRADNKNLSVFLNSTMTANLEQSINQTSNLNSSFIPTESFKVSGYGLSGSTYKEAKIVKKNAGTWLIHQNDFEREGGGNGNTKYSYLTGDCNGAGSTGTPYKNAIPQYGDHFELGCVKYIKNTNKVNVAIRCTQAKPCKFTSRGLNDVVKDGYYICGTLKNNGHIPNAKVVNVEGVRAKLTNATITELTLTIPSYQIEDDKPTANVKKAKFKNANANGFDFDEYKRVRKPYGMNFLSAEGYDTAKDYSQLIKELLTGDLEWEPEPNLNPDKSSFMQWLNTLFGGCTKYSVLLIGAFGAASIAITVGFPLVHFFRKKFLRDVLLAQIKHRKDAKKYEDDNEVEQKGKVTPETFIEEVLKAQEEAALSAENQAKGLSNSGDNSANNKELEAGGAEIEAKLVIQLPDEVIEAILEDLKQEKLISEKPVSASGNNQTTSTKDFDEEEENEIDLWQTFVRRYSSKKNPNSLLTPDELRLKQSTPLSEEEAEAEKLLAAEKEEITAITVQIYRPKTQAVVNTSWTQQWLDYLDSTQKSRAENKQAQDTKTDQDKNQTEQAPTINHPLSAAAGGAGGDDPDGNNDKNKKKLPDDGTDGKKAVVGKAKSKKKKEKPILHDMRVGGDENKKEEEIGPDYIEAVLKEKSDLNDEIDKRREKIIKLKATQANLERKMRELEEYIETYKPDYEEFMQEEGENCDKIRSALSNPDLSTKERSALRTQMQKLVDSMEKEKTMFTRVEQDLKRKKEALAGLSARDEIAIYEAKFEIGMRQSDNLAFIAHPEIIRKNIRSMARTLGVINNLSLEPEAEEAEQVQRRTDIAVTASQYNLAEIQERAQDLILNGKQALGLELENFTANCKEPLLLPVKDQFDLLVQHGHETEVAINQAYKKITIADLIGASLTQAENVKKAQLSFANFEESKQMADGISAIQAQIEMLISAKTLVIKASDYQLIPLSMHQRVLQEVSNAEKEILLIKGQLEKRFPTTQLESASANFEFEALKSELKKIQQLVIRAQNVVAFMLGSCLKRANATNDEYLALRAAAAAANPLPDVEKTLENIKKLDRVILEQSYKSGDVGVDIDRRNHLESLLQGQQRSLLSHLSKMILALDLNGYLSEPQRKTYQGAETRARDLMEGCFNEFVLLNRAQNDCELAKDRLTWIGDRKLELEKECQDAEKSLSQAVNTQADAKKIIELKETLIRTKALLAEEEASYLADLDETKKRIATLTAAAEAQFEKAKKTFSATERGVSEVKQSLIFAAENAESVIAGFTAKSSSINPEEIKVTTQKELLGKALGDTKHALQAAESFYDVSQLVGVSVADVALEKEVELLSKENEKLCAKKEELLQVANGIILKLKAQNYENQKIARMREVWKKAKTQQGFKSSLQGPPAEKETLQDPAVAVKARDAITEAVRLVEKEQSCGEKYINLEQANCNRHLRIINKILKKQSLKNSYPKLTTELTSIGEILGKLVTEVDPLNKNELLALSNIKFSEVLDKIRQVEKEAKEDEEAYALLKTAAEKLQQVVEKIFGLESEKEKLFKTSEEILSVIDLAQKEIRCVMPEPALKASVNAYLEREYETAIISKLPKKQSYIKKLMNEGKTLWSLYEQSARAESAAFKMLQPAAILKKSGFSSEDKITEPSHKTLKRLDCALSWEQTKTEAQSLLDSAQRNLIESVRQGLKEVMPKVITDAQYRLLKHRQVVSQASESEDLFGSLTHQAGQVIMGRRMISTEVEEIADNLTLMLTEQFSALRQGDFTAHSEKVINEKAKEMAQTTIKLYAKKMAEAEIEERVHPLSSEMFNSLSQAISEVLTSILTEHYREEITQKAQKLSLIESVDRLKEKVAKYEKIEKGIKYELEILAQEKFNLTEEKQEAKKRNKKANTTTLDKKIEVITEKMTKLAATIPRLSAKESLILDKLKEADELRAEVASSYNPESIRMLSKADPANLEGRVFQEAVEAVHDTGNTRLIFELPDE